jgi:hypothetical protein
MLEYRLYCLDERGRILHSHDFEAADDQEAIQIADRREHPHFAGELWQRGRKVEVIPAKDVGTR